SAARARVAGGHRSAALLGAAHESSRASARRIAARVRRGPQCCDLCAELADGGCTAASARRSHHRCRSLRLALPSTEELRRRRSGSRTHRLSTRTAGPSRVGELLVRIPRTDRRWRVHPADRGAGAGSVLLRASATYDGEPEAWTLSLDPCGTRQVEDR